ncbi:MAG: hypothetical protein WBP64_18310 [Nitrososphaeraceae archaeon]
MHISVMLFSDFQMADEYNATISLTNPINSIDAISDALESIDSNITHLDRSRSEIRNNNTRQQDKLNNSNEVYRNALNDIRSLGE